MNVRGTLLLATALLFGGGCTLFSTSESLEPDPGLDVVDDEGPFDPSEAVDDEDDEEAGARSGADEGQAETAAPDEASGDTSDEASAEAEGEPPPAAEVGEDAPEPPGDELDSAPREDVDPPSEVARKKAVLEAATEVANAGEDDDSTKRALAHNPEPESPGEAESNASEAVDLVGEGLLLAVLALPLTLLVFGLRRSPLVGTLLLVAAALGYWAGSL